MARSVILMNFTDQGARSASESPKRAAAFKESAAKLGVEVKSVYWTLGRYDVVLTLEGSEEAVAGAMMKAAELGNVHTQTLRAFTADELGRITGKAS
jgi:uncharacterized protein with GYD domain